LSVPVPLATKMLAVLMVPPGDDDDGDADGLGTDGADGDADGLGGGADGLGEGGADVGLAAGLGVGFFETARRVPMIRWPTTSCPRVILAEPVRTGSRVPTGGGARCGFGAW
jgi:hypothetical protein